MENDIGSDRLGEAGDAFYEALMAAHAGLSDDQSIRLNARLVLILANQIGDQKLLERALAEARKGLA